MGVQGLWHLLQPCARPTKLESLEGRRLAIDSSIWLYHFQMAMRDKEGRTLSNAHILGFLWRILKLIHYGIRPIFVFDGGAPVMKRQTLVGRRQRKAGAKDDHRKIAERLLNARLREAAISHVAGGGGTSGSSKDIQSNAGDVSTAMRDGPESHGLGQNTVYFDDLAGGSGSTSMPNRTNDDDSAWVNEMDDGAVSKEKEVQGEEDLESQKKKKRNDWHKDPYALPALERDINTLTANNSSAAKNARGGGKRQDVRFATEGELRALLSSIGPTDLDLDSEFFRSLPSELQYELVGDMRAASRGTSYKRLQSMLSQSPTPIDFSRAQIAGLKTRNELTQKVLEVTDEIGDAHIKVPIRVAGARNREYVLVRNKGDQGGFALGVREAGTTQEKAIAVDEDTASATTTDDDFERKNTDEEVELEEVTSKMSPEKPRVKETIPPELLHANPNDPAARKEVAKELLQRRARALAKEKAKEQGINDESEEMEEQLRKAKELKLLSKQKNGRKSGSGGNKSLFRPKNMNRGKGITIDLDEEEEEEDDAEWEELLDQHEAADLVRALEESEKANPVEKEEEKEVEEEGEEFDLEEVPTHMFDADDYSVFYGKTETKAAPPPVSQAPPTWLSDKSVENSNRATLGGPALSFRLQDRNGQPEGLDRRLLMKRPTHYDDDDDGSVVDSKTSEKRAGLDNGSTKRPPSPLPLPASQSTDNVKRNHSRIISISDSDADASDEEVKEEKTHINDSHSTSAQPEGTRVTMRSEQTEMPTEGGNEVKVVDFQDRQMKDSERVSDKEEEEETVMSAAENVPSRETSPSPPQSPIEIAETESLSDQESLASHTPSQQSEVVTPRPEETKVGKSPSIVSLSEDEDGTSSPMGEARRAEERLPSPLDIAMEDDLTKEIDENINEVKQELADKEVEDYTKFVSSQADAELPEQEEARESEEEHSDYSNQGYGKGQDSSSDEDSETGRPPQVVLGPDGFPLPTAEEFAAMDAEDEAELGEMENDQDEFVSFLSRAKGQGLNQIRKEVEDEVNKLRSEHATTRRTEGEVTQQMAKEIQFMLRLFGLPYITAPMEAEAQCAELIALKLADGIITDDSDVFLFGGTFIYKNMFNNKKYVECYKLSDLQHDLGMDRTKLVQLAYLLGSDYTEGLEGVGPVLAMEILSHFPGDDGLVKFREWWLKVQTGKDTVKDTYDSTLKRLKRTLRNKVHLESHWPDPNVIDAYFEPTVDDSKEPFQWGLPDLDSLRSFFGEYLRWDKEKTDHYLIPAIEAQNRRSRRQGTQSTLDRGNFFDLSAGEGVYAGRKRAGYGSSRLQQVIKNFRASNSGKGPRKEKRKGGNGIDDEEVDLISVSEEEGEEEVIPEQLLGKEMGKRSRPVVRRKGTSKRDERATEEQEENGSVGNGKRRKGRKRKASDTNQRENVHDQEWRPTKAKKKKSKAKASEGSTTLSQGRNMSLDTFDTIPISRGDIQSRRPEARKESHMPIVLGDDDDDEESSSLSEEAD